MLLKKYRREKTMLKKITAVIACLAIAASVVGCGKKAHCGCCLLGYHCVFCRMRQESNIQHRRLG